MSRPTLFQRVREVFSPCPAEAYFDVSPGFRCNASFSKCMSCPRMADLKLGMQHKRPAWKPATTPMPKPTLPAAWVDALLCRAKTSLLTEVCTPSQKPEQFAFWQGAINTLQRLRNGQAANLAAKDEGLPYEAPRVLKAAGDVLDSDSYLLPRAEIEQRLKVFGIKVPLQPVADGDGTAADPLVHVGVASRSLDSKKTAHAVESNDGSNGHAGSVVEGAQA